MGDTLSLPLTAGDTDGDTLTFTASGLPSGLSIDSEGNITGTIGSTADTGSPYSVTVTASDGTNSQSQTFNWMVSHLLITNPGDQTNADGDVVSLQITATDNNSDDTISYSAAGLPPGLSINSSTGIISGTIASNDDTSSPYTVTVTATTGTDSDSQTFSWTVTNPLSIDNPGGQINADGDKVSLQINAASTDNGTLTYSATGLPPGLSIDASTGLISGTISSTADSASPYLTTVTVGEGTLSASQMFGWEVDHLVLMNPGDQSNAVGDTVSLQLSASDHAGDVLTYSANGLPEGLSIDPSTGLISGTISLSASVTSQYAVSVAVTDGTHIATQQFIWNVAKIKMAPLSDVNDFAGDSASIQVSAEDNFGQSIEYSAAGLPSGIGIDSTTGLISGTVSPSATPTSYTVTVTATAGIYAASQTFIWNVSQLGLTAPPDQVNADGDQVSLAVPSNAPEGTTLQYTATGLPAGLTIDNNGIISGTIASTADTTSPYSVMVTATDGTGATATASFNWTVLSLLLLNPGDQVYGVGDQVSLQIIARDNDTGPITYSATGLPPDLSIDSSTGLISGKLSTTDQSSTPYPVTVVAQASNNRQAQQQFTVQVNPLDVTFFAGANQLDPRKPLPLGIGNMGLSDQYGIGWKITAKVSDANYLDTNKLKFEITDNLGGTDDEGASRAFIDGPVTVNKAAGGFSFYVYGKKKTPNVVPDTRLEAIDISNPAKEVVVSSVPLSVVIPASIKAPRTNAPGDIVAGTRFASNSSTKEPLAEVKPPFFAIGTHYVTPIKMTVYDQFGNVLSSIYNDNSIWEAANTDDAKILNIPLVDGSFVDPVGWLDYKTEKGKLVRLLKTDPLFKQWLAGLPGAFGGTDSARPLKRTRFLLVDSVAGDKLPIFFRYLTVTPVGQLRARVVYEHSF